MQTPILLTIKWVFLKVKEEMTKEIIKIKYIIFTYMTLISYHPIFILAEKT